MSDNEEECSKKQQEIEMLSADGEPKNIKITGYWKYSFTIEFQTNNYNVRLICGGEPNSIYRFDPFGGWNEWEGVEIQTISYTKN